MLSLLSDCGLYSCSVYNIDWAFQKSTNRLSWSLLFTSVFEFTIQLTWCHSDQNSIGSSPTILQLHEKESFNWHETEKSIAQSLPFSFICSLLNDVYLQLWEEMETNVYDCPHHYTIPILKWKQMYDCPHHYTILFCPITIVGNKNNPRSPTMSGESQLKTLSILFQPSGCTIAHNSCSSHN